MIIDVHAHHTPQALTRALAEQPRPTRRPAHRHPSPPLAFEDRLGLMEEAGVERQILSIASGFYSEDESTGVRCASGVNDELSQLCVDRPQQFSFWASLPLPHIAASLSEAERALALPGCVGVTINCAILGRSIADEIFDPLYAMLNAHRAIVFLHPCQNGLMSPLITNWDLTVCVGASMEDAVAALHLIQRQIPLRYPNLRFIVPHFGGLLPMLLNRLDGQMLQDGFAELPSATARRFFYDTVGWGSKAALIAAVEAFGAGQVVPGSDYPILLGWESYAQTFAHIREAGLPPAIVEQILYRNVQERLGLGAV
jgi:aminocarboxymuconate-semialdehyde decarboxylase